MCLVLAMILFSLVHWPQPFNTPRRVRERIVKIYFCEFSPWDN